MFRVSALALLVLCLCPLAFSQSTTVSGTITDSGGQSWNNGTFNFVFVPSPQSPVGPYTWTGGTLPTNIGGSLSGTGTYSVSIPSNNAISPIQTAWTVTFCPQASSGCFTITKVSITGTTLTLNATPPAILINLSQATPPVLAYTDSEITGTALGSQYFNLVSVGLKTCTAISGNNCTTWVVPGSTASSLAGPGSITGSFSGTHTESGVVTFSNASSTFAGNAATATTATTATNLTGPGAISGTFSGSSTLTGNLTQQGTNTHSGTETFTGALNAKNLESIRFADQFAGADCGAKINAADSDLGGSAGEIWVNLNCGTTWTTAVSLSANHVIRFIQYANYTTSATVTLNANHAGIMCDGPQISTTPLCGLVEASSANLPYLIYVAPGADGAFVRDLFVFGNHGPGNQTAGVCIKVDRAARFNLEDSTVAGCQTHAIWIHSTGTNNESHVPKILRALIGTAFGDGIYSDNTADGFLGEQSESGNNGLLTGTSRPLVSTTNTTITYASGGPLTGWSTDTSLVGTMLRVNDAIRCQVLAVPSTTTITVSATQCWNNSGVVTALGTLTNVPLNWGNGVELNSSPTWRIIHTDLGANAMDGVLGYGLVAGGLTNGETEITGGNQAGGNLENGIEVIGYDTVGAAITNSGWMIVGNTINGGTNGPATPTWANILLVDPQGVTVTGNTFNTSASPQAKYAISAVESSAGRAGTVYAAGNVTNGASAAFATSFYNDSTQNGAIGLQIPCRIGITGALDIFDITAGAATPHTYVCNSAGNFLLRNNSGNPMLTIDQSGDVFGIGIFLPNTPATQLGTTGNPFGSFFIGTASTNNFKFQPAATAAARIIQIADPGATSGLLLGGTNLTFSPTAPTIAAAGCGGSAAAIQNANGTASFNIFTGTAPTSGGCTITMPSATTNWHCEANHVSAISTTNFIIQQTGALSTTSVTLQLFSDVAAATAPAASDTWRTTCTAN